MSLENSNMYMPVAPAYYGNGYGNNGMGDLGNGWWLIILLLFGYGGFGGNWGNGGNQNGVNGMYPWMNQMDAMNQGFAQQSLNTAVGDIRNDMNRGFADNQLSISGLSQQICQTGGTLTNALNQGFAQSEISANNRQMANMQQSYSNAQAISSRLDNMAMTNQQCCCDNKAAIADLKYTVATENCADRYEASQNARDIIENANRNNQAILDKLCALELDNVKSQLAAEQRESANLRNQLSMASMNASQTAQTAQILAGQAQRASEVEQYVNPTPRPAYVVQNPNCCQGYTVTPNCGCGNGFMG